MNGTKGFFQSKIIWLALLGLGFQLIAPLIGQVYDPATGDMEESIVDLIFGGGEWVNIGANVLIILARWFFASKKIEGAIVPGAGMLGLVLLFSVGSLRAAPATPFPDHDGISTFAIIHFGFDTVFIIPDRNTLNDWLGLNEYKNNYFAILPTNTDFTAFLPYRRARDGLRCGDCEDRG